MKIELDGNPVEVIVRRGRSRKTADIEFKSRDQLIVTLPRDVEIDVDALLKRHEQLLKRKYREYLSRQKILDGDRILIQGKRYKIEVKKVEEPEGERVFLQDDSLIIQLKPKESPAIILKQWITKQTEILANRILEEYSKHFETRPRKMFIQDTRRWGYCKKNGDIVLNWQLSALPPELARYVVIHELTHLSALNHKNQFYTKLAKFYPNYSEMEKELKTFLAIEPNFQFKHKRP